MVRPLRRIIKSHGLERGYTGVSAIGEHLHFAGSTFQRKVMMENFSLEEFKYVAKKLNLTDNEILEVIRDA